MHCRCVSEGTLAEQLTVVSQVPTLDFVGAEPFNTKDQSKGIACIHPQSSSGNGDFGSGNAAGVCSRNYRITAVEVGSQLTGDGHFAYARSLVDKQDIRGAHCGLKFSFRQGINKRNVWDALC